jgi:hypothetical protein
MINDAGIFNYVGNVAMIYEEKRVKMIEDY